MTTHPYVTADWCSKGFDGDKHRYRSPFYGESHFALREMVRTMIEEEFNPNISEWDEAGELPQDVRERAYLTGMAVLACGSPFPVEYGPPLPIFLKNVKLDIFHAITLFQEVTRTGSIGIGWGLGAGLCIGLPPVLTFGSDEMKRRVAPGVLAGKKIICLAVTEPTAGSDVARIKTTAELSPCKQFFIVNGEKKWITNGIWADYFTVAVRTGDMASGMKGISLLLLERSMAGITTKKMKCSGVWCSGTTYITFDNVKVPVSNLIGKLNKGFKYIVHNFNYERIIICAQAVGSARCCYEEALAQAHRRKTFGKSLIDHQVIKWKLGEMVRNIESCQSWLENLAFQVSSMHPREADYKLGGPTALLKVQCTKVLEYCAREAAQIFGGLSFSRGGLGGKVERLCREVRSLAIPGGSEEIMIDLGVRMTTKVAQMANQFLAQEEHLVEGKKSSSNSPIAMARKVGVNVDIYGEGNPFCDPSWYLTFNTPWYSESHKRVRDWIRSVISTALMNSSTAGNSNRTTESEQLLIESLFEHGVGGLAGGSPYNYSPLCLKNISVDKFHELIVLDELSRTGLSNAVNAFWGNGVCAVVSLLRNVGAINGATNSLSLNGHPIALSSLIESIQKGSLKAVLLIQEPGGFNQLDDLNLVVCAINSGTTLTGNKICTNPNADIFIVLAKDSATNQLALALVHTKTVEKRLIPTVLIDSRTNTVSFTSTSCVVILTTRITETLNIVFTKQRWASAVQSIRYSRICFQEALVHAQEKECFGKLLINHQGTRFKLGEMARQIEGAFAWLEQVTYQRDPSPGVVALLKLHATKLVENCVSESFLILGTVTEMSEKTRLVTNCVVPLSLNFGSENVLLDQGINLHKL